MWFELPLIGFIIVFLATSFLFGELLVKGRGILGILGLGLIIMYFSYFLTPSNFFWLCLLYAVGLVLVVLDFKIANHGLFALIGIVVMMASVAIPAPSFMFGVLVCAAFLVGLGMSFMFLKILPPRDLWSKLTLKDQLTEDKGYNSLNESYKDLVGREGIAVTPFRPIGTVEVDDQPYSAITEGKWLKKDVAVLITEVDGTRIVVKEKKEDADST